MAILRAGPFASVTDSFLNEPGSPSAGITPVNCAKDTSSTNWPWSYYKEISNSEDSGQDVDDYLVGLPSVSASYTSSSGDEGGIITSRFSFSCQCASEIVFSLTYDLSASQSFEFAFVSIEVFINNASDFSDSDSEYRGTASLSGTRDITIQKSVVPTQIKVVLNAQENSTVNGGSASISCSLSFS